MAVQSLLDTVNVACASINNREWAILVWMSLFVCWLLLRKDTRTSVFSFVCLLFSKKIFLIYFFLILYILASVFVLEAIGLWSPVHLKETVVWFLGTACIMLMNSVRVSGYAQHFTRILKESVSWSVIVMFIGNFFTLSFLAELFIAPVLVLVVGIGVVAGAKYEYKLLEKLTNLVLGGWGLFLMMFFLFKLFTSGSTFFVIDSLLQFTVPIMLTFILLPFVYFFCLIAVYEEWHVRFSAVLLQRAPTLPRSIVWRLVKTFGFNLISLEDFLQVCRLDLVKVRSLCDFEDLLEAYIVRKK